VKEVERGEWAASTRSGLVFPKKVDKKKIKVKGSLGNAKRTGATRRQVMGKAGGGKRLGVEWAESREAGKVIFYFFKEGNLQERRGGTHGDYHGGGNQAEGKREATGENSISQRGVKPIYLSFDSNLTKAPGEGVN